EATEAAYALDLLEQAGLVVRDEKKKPKQAETKLITPPEVTSLAVRNFHRAMIERATDASEAPPKEERNLTTLTFSLPQEHYKEFCQRIWEFERELADRVEEIAEREEGVPGDVFQLNVQLFPLTRKKEES